MQANDIAPSHHFKSFIRKQHANGNNTTVKFRTERNWIEQKEREKSDPKKAGEKFGTHDVLDTCRLCVCVWDSHKDIHKHTHTLVHIPWCTYWIYGSENSLEPITEAKHSMKERLKNRRGKDTHEEKKRNQQENERRAVDPKISVLILVLEHIIYFP